jgi:hypothetical protein
VEALLFADGARFRLALSLLCMPPFTLTFLKMGTIMKYLLVLLALVTVQAQARIQGPLYKLISAAEQSPSMFKIVKGELVLGDREIEMQLVRHLDCDSGMMCPQVMPTPIYTKLPIISYKKTSCGDKIIAAKDLRFVDGAIEKLEIIDYTHATCEIALPALVQVRHINSYFDRLNGKTVTTVDQFGFDLAVHILPIDR